MKTSIKFLSTTAIATALIATLAGCVTQPDTNPAPTGAPRRRFGRAGCPGRG